MTELEKYGQYLIDQVLSINSGVYTVDQLEWRKNENYAFGFDVIVKETNEVIMHTHASFPMTDDTEILAKEMRQVSEQIDNGDYDLVLDVDEGITDKNYLEHLDNPYVQEWLNKSRNNI